MLFLVPSLAACSDHNACNPAPVQKRLEVETPTDPAMTLKIQSCQVDVDACPALCALALERVQLAAFGVNSCKVGFAGATVYMDVDYTPASQDCFFGDDDVVFATGGAK